MLPEEGQEDLFQIKLNENGRNTIFKTARFAVITIAIAIFNNLTNLFLVAFRSYKFNFSESKTDPLYRWFFWLAVLILNLISTVIYFFGASISF